MNGSRWKGLLIPLVLASNTLAAQCTEGLCEPEIAIAPGTSFAGGGIGLFLQPDVIAFDVPEDATVVQVLVYWNGFDSTGAGDDVINVGGDDVVGQRIGGPTLFFAKHYSSTYRADITELGLVATGANSIEVSGLDFDQVSNGASIVAVIDDGST
jgi:hypothetical protein